MKIQRLVSGLGIVWELSCCGDQEAVESEPFAQKLAALIQKVTPRPKPNHRPYAAYKPDQLDLFNDVPKNLLKQAPPNCIIR
jgi:hypothetical protein